MTADRESRAPELRVHGGTRGIAARVEDIERASRQLRRLAGQLAASAAAMAAVGARPALLLTAPVSPATWARAEAALAAATVGPGGLVALAARAEWLGTRLGMVAGGYRAADAVAASGLGAACPAPVLVARSWLGRDLGDQLVAVLPGLAPGLGAASLILHGGGAARGWRSTMRELAGLGAVAGRATPWLRESARARVAPGPPRPVRAPAGVAELLATIPPASGPPTVRVVRVSDAAGSRAWIVSIPGTASWNPRPGANPFDLTGNVRLMAGAPTAASGAVASAMAAAGVGPGEPVLLTGYSQGGMVAAELAADPAFRRRYAVTSVVTAGSPIAWSDMPAGVRVLSLEHTDDLVPHLDGAANPDRPNWVTVSATAGGFPVLAGVAGQVPLATHDLGVYRWTAAAVDSSADPSLQESRADLAPFLDRPGARALAHDVTAWRVLP